VLLEEQRHAIDAKTYVSECVGHPWSHGVNDPHVSFTTKAFGSVRGLIPIVIGGPWHYNGSYWEAWRHGEYNHGRTVAPPRNHDRQLQYHAEDGRWFRWVFQDHDLHELELHAPKGWPKEGDEVPEGCYVKNPKDEKPAEFKVGDRVRSKATGHTGTLRGFAEAGGWWTWYRDHRDPCLGSSYPCDLEHLPASEDPLPRKKGVIVYEVTAEEFNTGQASKAHHRYVHEGYWSIRGVGVQGGHIHWASPRDLLRDAKPGETWIVCRE
jgi:hypothetical protein